MLKPPANFAALLPVAASLLMACGGGSAPSSVDGASAADAVSPTYDATPDAFVPGVPGPPRAVVAVARNSEASATWQAPVNDGGSAILSYRVVLSPAMQMLDVTEPQAVFTSLSNGTEVVFHVAAVNEHGAGAVELSNPVTPATLPGAPTNVSALAGNGQATVSWTLAEPGGAAITRYRVVSEPGAVTADVTAPPAIVTGLANGTSYAFRVTATNAVGNGTASALSNSVTPATVPGPPLAVTATTNGAVASVSWTAPGSTGGLPIANYTVTSSPDALTSTTPTTATTLSGLRIGVPYTFTVTATNPVGTSAPSSPSAPVTPSCGAGLALSAVNGGNVGTLPIALAKARLSPTIDSHHDILVANFTSNSISRLLGNGSGGFSNNDAIAAGTGPRAIAVGDFNRDGNPDVAVANSTANTVSIYLTQGDLPMLSTTLSVGSNPFSIAAADLTGDGNVDLAVANHDSNSVSVFIGSATGTFAPGTTLTVGAQPTAIVAGAVDTDAHIDLVVATNAGATATVYPGSGTGTFVAGQVLSTTSGHKALALADFDADGDMDLAMSVSTATDTVRVYQNAGGTLGSVVSVNVGDNPQSVDAGDFDADGDLDLVTANFGHNNITLVRRGSGGTYTTTNYSFPVGTQPRAALFAQLDSDALLEVVVARGAQNALSIVNIGCN